MALPRFANNLTADNTLESISWEVDKAFSIISVLCHFVGPNTLLYNCLQVGLKQFWKKLMLQFNCQKNQKQSKQMSTQVVMSGEMLQNESVQKYREMLAQMESSIHEHKKALLQAKSELQYERARADEFQEKYKGAIRYQNEEMQLKKIMNELNEKLRLKEDELLELLKSQHQKNFKISNLESDLEESRNIHEEFQERIKQIQEGAISAIIEKENIIAQLQEKLHLFELNESTNTSNLNFAIMELEEKYKQLQDRSEATKMDLESLLQQREEQLRDLQERSQHQKEKLEQKISRMEQQIMDYEKHIEHINEQKILQENLEEKSYLLEQKLRKSEKRNSELELILSDVKKEYEDFLNKFTQQQDEHKNFVEEIKSLKLKIKDMGTEIKDKEKSAHQLKVQYEKTINEVNKKVSILQSEKRKVNDSLEAKNIEIQRLRLEIDEKVAQLSEQKNRKSRIQSSKKLTDSRVSLAAEIKNVHLSAEKFVSPVKVIRKQSEDQTRQIEKFKHQISDLQANNVLLSKKLEEKNKQLQQLRQQLVSKSGSASRSQEEAKLMCVIEDLSNHIKKLENNMITQKYKYAEDENFWKMKEKNFKQQIDNLTKQFKKQRSELLQRIDRMKKSGGGKDKKMDYYQSGFR